MTGQKETEVTDRVFEDLEIKNKAALYHHHLGRSKDT